MVETIDVNGCCLFVSQMTETEDCRLLWLLVLVFGGSFWLKDLAGNSKFWREAQRYGGKLKDMAGNSNISFHVVIFLPAILPNGSLCFFFIHFRSQAAAATPTRNTDAVEGQKYYYIIIIRRTSQHFKVLGVNYWLPPSAAAADDED
jgi:hypothetical protein